MGLHSRVRYVIQPQGNNRTEQMRDIIDRAVYLFYAVRPQFCPDKQSMTCKFARWASRCITFIGFTDDEVKKGFVTLVANNYLKTNTDSGSWARDMVGAFKIGTVFSSETGTISEFKVAE